MRAMPSHSVATNESTAMRRTSSAASAEMRAGTMRSMPPSSYFAE